MSNYHERVLVGNNPNGKGRRSCWEVPSSRALQIFGVVVGVAIMSMFIALLAGGLQTSTVMNHMRGGMDDMNAQMKMGAEAATKFVVGLKGKFPVNQPEVTTRQMLGIVENAHKISARAQYLLDNVQPEAIGQTVQNINLILGAVTPAEVTAVKEHLLAIVGNVDRLVAQLPADKVAALIDTASKLSSTQLNALITKFAKIHEINMKIQV